MNKPLTVARQEFLDKISDVINHAELPAFVVADIFRDCVRQLEQITRQQYESEKQQWEEQQKKANESKPISKEEKETVVKILNEAVKNKESE